MLQSSSAEGVSTGDEFGHEQPPPAPWHLGDGESVGFGLGQAQTYLLVLAIWTYACF